MNRLKVLSVAVFSTILSLFVGSQADAGYVYMRSTAGAPWGQTTNEQAMNAAFGAANWQDLRFETASVAAVFSASNSFVFLEGGDITANELELFLTTNLPAIEAWVNGGGSLFINSAPNEGNGMSYGFGGVNLTYADFSSNPVFATNAAHPIFNGPLATQTSFSGNFYAHASVAGGGVTDLIQDATGSVYLAEKAHGQGHVMFGGMTTTNWHSPQPAAFNLRVNILTYGAAQGDTQAVPVPGGVVLFGLGLATLGAGRFVRRRVTKA